MPSVDELLERQKKRLEKMGSPAPRKNVRIERHGPQRPWQDNLPEYNTASGDQAVRETASPELIDKAAPSEVAASSSPAAVLSHQEAVAPSAVKAASDVTQPVTTGNKKHALVGQPGTTGNKLKAIDAQPVTTGNKVVEASVSTDESTGNNREQTAQATATVTGNNREQILRLGKISTGNNREQVSYQPGTTTGNNREQAVLQPVTTGNKAATVLDQPETTTGNNREQIADKPVTTGNKAPRLVDLREAATGNNREQIADKPVTTGNKTSILPDQPGTVTGSDHSRSRLQGSSFPVAEPINREQPGTVTGSKLPRKTTQPGTAPQPNREQVQSQPGTETGNNREQIRPNDPALPTGAQQVLLLQLLADQQQSAGLDHTPRIKRATLAASLGTTEGVVKTQLVRLCARGYVERINARDGRGEAGTVYRVSPTAARSLQAINREQKPGTTGNKLSLNREQKHSSTGNKNREQAADLSTSSSSFINTTTTTTELAASNAKLLHDEVAQALESFDCVDLLNANDVLQIWRHKAQPFTDMADLLDSVAHIAFYVQSEAGQALGKGWVMKTLLKGYYGPPAGFKSVRERQREETLRRAAARREQARADFDANFELWLANLAGSDRKKLLEETLRGAVTFVSPAVAKQTLLNHFARSEGLHEYCTDDSGA